METKIKRSIALRIIIAIFIALYFTVFFSSLFVGGSAYKIWFSIFLFLTAGVYIIKGVFFHLDASILLGLFFLVWSILSGIIFFTTIEFLPQAYLFGFSLACLIVYVIFRQKIHLVLFVLLFIEMLLLVGFKVFTFKQFFWILQSIYAIFIVVLLIYAIKKVGEKE